MNAPKATDLDSINFLLAAPRVVSCTEVEPVIHSREGVIGHLRRNLARLKLSDIARIYVGDFREAPRYAYRTIFCDATHTPYEIALTVRGLAPFLAEGVVLACREVLYHAASAHHYNPLQEKSARRSRVFIECASIVLCVTQSTETT
jgi:hypothetical protein